MTSRRNYFERSRKIFAIAQMAAYGFADRRDVAGHRGQHLEKLRWPEADRSSIIVGYPTARRGAWRYAKEYEFSTCSGDQIHQVGREYSNWPR